MMFSLIVFALLATFLFSTMFLPIFVTAWRREEEIWRSRKRQWATTAPFPRRPVKSGA
ncbi:MAG: hypothetical protein AB7G75_22530 [Candidatus Binatia bacterium]